MSSICPRVCGRFVGGKRRVCGYPLEKGPSDMMQGIRKRASIARGAEDIGRPELHETGNLVVCSAPRLHGSSLTSATPNFCTRDIALKRME